MNILRVSTYPTKEKPGMGLHPYYLSSNSKNKIFYLTPRDAGERKDIPDNVRLIESGFLSEPRPNNKGFLISSIFLLKRLLMIVRFSITGCFLLVSNRIAVVHIHSPMYSLIGLFGRLLGKKVYITFHGTDFHRVKSSRIYRSFNWLYHGVFAISPDMLEPLRKIHGVNKVHQVVNGIDCEQFSDFGLVRKKQIIAVGSLKPEKGFSMLIKAFNIFTGLKEGGQSYSLIICGDGLLKSNLNSMAVKMGLKDRVIFKGHLGHDELISLYNESEIFSLSSISEGFPKVLLEAMACGCKIVATEVGSVSEVMKDCDFLASHNEEDFAKQLLMASEKNYQNLSDGYGRVLTKYDWGSVIDIYTEVMGE